MATATGARPEPIPGRSIAGRPGDPVEGFQVSSQHEVIGLQAGGRGVPPGRFEVPGEEIILAKVLGSNHHGSPPPRARAARSGGLYPAGSDVNRPAAENPDLRRGPDSSGEIQKRRGSVSSLSS